MHCTTKQYNKRNEMQCNAFHNEHTGGPFPCESRIRWLKEDERLLPGRSRGDLRGD